ncbi:MAG: hypothetical protein Cons2KO_27860 [Congregibacter sp.]
MGFLGNVGRCLWVPLVVAVMTHASPLSAATTELVVSECESLSRENIDCACVGERLKKFNDALPSAADPDLLLENYRYLLGKKNRFREAFEASASTPTQIMQIEMAMDGVGGRPTGINEFEAGCVIQGAGRNTLPSYPEEAMTTAYVESCKLATGVARYCHCAVATKRNRVSKEEFEAYYRSFSDYSDKNALSLAELSAMRAKNMQITVDEYQSLARKAREVIEDHEERDENLCAALIWPDNAGPEAWRKSEDPADASNADGRPAEGAVTGGAARVISTSSSAYPRAAQLVVDSCLAQGSSQAYCGCLLDDVEQQVFSQMDSETLAVAYAMMQGGVDLDPMAAMSVLGSLDGAQQMRIAMLTGQVDVGSACSAD